MKKLYESMAEAARLTQAGRLSEATAVIQRELAGDFAPAATADATRPSDGDYIDAEFQVVDSSGHTPAGASDAGAAAAAAPAGCPGRFIAGSYSEQAGSRNYKLYIPAGYSAERSLPLIVMLHGCTQNPDDFAAGTRMNQLAEQQPCLVLYPEQAASANPSVCWNWFQPADQQRDQGEPAIIAGMTRQISNDYAVDSDRVYVAGLSAGGAMAAILARTYPDIYAAAGIHSGLAYGSAHSLASALSAMKQGGKQRHVRSALTLSSSGLPERSVPTIVFHGELDTTVNPLNGEQIIAQSMNMLAQQPLHASTERERAAGGHAYTRTQYSDSDGHVRLEQWLVHGAAHAWSGGSSDGSYTDSRGPDASRAMLDFFNQHILNRI
jgi:poly(hydroxyalkanoate) depolymerase family esterase